MCPVNCMNCKFRMKEYDGKRTDLNSICILRTIKNVIYRCKDFKLR